jgi:hypothetical protein
MTEKVEKDAMVMAACDLMGVHGSRSPSSSYVILEVRERNDCARGD